MMYPISHERQTKPANENWWLHHLASQQPWVPFILSAKTKQTQTKKNPKYSGLSYHPSSAPDHQWRQNIGSDKPCVLNLLVPRYKSHSELHKKGLREDPWGGKWVPQGTQSQRQVWFPGWNVSWLKWFISTSLEHARHMLPFALRRLPCSRAGNRQGYESMARHWTPSLWNSSPILQFSRTKPSKMVKKVTKKTTGIKKKEKKPTQFSVVHCLWHPHSDKHKQNIINLHLKAGGRCLSPSPAHTTPINANRSLPCIKEQIHHKTFLSAIITGDKI